MSQRLTNILGYLTLFALLGAIWILFGEDQARDQGGRGDRTFAGMESRINDVQVLALVSGEQTVTLERGEAGWLLRERDGYRADDAKIRAVLRGIALSERREPKTANAKRFERIGLGEKAVKVTLLDIDGTDMLTFDAGKRSAVSGDRSLTYILQQSDTRSWLVTALGEVSADPAWWLDKALIDIDEARVCRITLGDAVLTRALGQSDLALDSLTAEEKQVPAWKLSEPLRSLAGLSFTDVIALGNPLSETVANAELVTHDGLRITAGLYDRDGATWAQLAATFDAELLSTGEAGELPAAPADGAAEAEALQGRFRGWIFKLAPYDAETLKRGRSDFIEAQEADGNTTP